MSCFYRGANFGKTLRTGRYRIVRWTDRKTGKVAQIELYGPDVDPQENDNVAADNPYFLKPPATYALAG